MVMNLSLSVDENGEKDKNDPNYLKTKKGSVYVGESSRSGFERSKEHWDDDRSESDDSHIHKHWVNMHGGLGSQCLSTE